MNQKIAWSTFLSGMVLFLSTFGEFFTSHSSWQSMSTPNEVGHMLIMTASLVVAIFGALGANLPRNQNTRLGDGSITYVPQVEEVKPIPPKTDT